MEMGKYVQSSDNLYWMVRVLLIGFLAALGLCGYLVYRNDQLVKHEKITYWPVGLNARATLSDSSASDSYLKAMAQTVVNLALNYSTPSAAAVKFGELVDYYTQDGREAARKEFLAEVETIKRGNVTSAFDITRIEVRPDGAIEIAGIKKLFVNDVLSKNESKTYILEYRVRDYRFEIVNFVEKI